MTHARSPRRSNRLSRFLLQGRHWWLAAACLLAVIAFVHRNRVDFDRSVENLLSPNDPLLAAFRLLKRTFGGNEIVLAVYTDPELLAADGHGIRRLQSIAERCRDVPGVGSVLSLDRVMGDAIVTLDTGVAKRTLQLFEGYTHNREGNVAVVVCMLQSESEAGASRTATIDQLRQVLNHLPEGLPSGMVTGEPVMLVDGFRFVQLDGNRLGRWSSLLMGLTILVCFRDWRWVFVCVAVVQSALLTTQATLALLGLRLSMVSSMLTAVVTVVGVATVVHIIVRFREAQRTGHGARYAAWRTCGLLAIPVLWACTTDGVGFAALASASVKPVQDFGIMMAIGCLAVLASTAMIVPALAMLFPAPKNIRRDGSRWERRLRQGLRAFADSISRRPGVIAVVAGIPMVLAICGVRFLRVETDFTRNFHRDSQIVVAYEFVEDRLGGAGVCDLLIPAPESLNWEFLRGVRELEARIEQEAGDPGSAMAGITKVLSLADAVLAGAPRIDALRPPFTQTAVAAAGLAAMKTKIPSFYRALYGQDPQSGQHYLRVMLRAREQQPAEKKRAMIARLQQLSSEAFPGTKVTGFFVLLTNLVDSIVKDQWRTFAVATLGIGFTMLVALRSGWLTLAALVPNALPILVVSGVMGWITRSGWFDFRINMGSAMIAAVSLGLSIDSSIHYIYAFRREKEKTGSVTQALAAAHESVGLSMLFSTIALIVGFAVLITSEFVPTVYFGWLVTLAMIGGLLGNLVVLPLLLNWIYTCHRPRAKKVPSWHAPSDVPRP